MGTFQGPCHSLEADTPDIRVTGAWKVVAPGPGPHPHQRLSGLTTPEPRFIQTMVSDGFPVQAQLKTASEPRSTSRDWGSAVIRGPTMRVEG